MYKQASQLKLRFSTPKGVLSVEQLWDLTLTDLSTTIKAVKKAINKDNDDDLSFLTNEETTNPVAQLTFDILKDVYLTKKKENADAREAAENKAHNQKILQLIAEKKDESLKGMSIEELEKQLK